MRSRREKGKNVVLEIDEKMVCFLGIKPLSLYVGGTFCNGSNRTNKELKQRLDGTRLERV